MILTTSLLSQILVHRNTNVIITGSNFKFIKDSLQLSTFKLIHMNDIDYHSYDNIYYLNIESIKKKIKVVDLLKEICIAPNFYSEQICKKVIILSNFNVLNYIYQQAIKTIIDTSYLSCMFLIHTRNLTSIDNNLKSRCLILSLPYAMTTDTTINIMYHKIITLLKGTLTTKVIGTIREMSYMYYMNHTHSIDLQMMLVSHIGSNISIPNSIKEQVIKDICRINVLYQHSYRKPIFLEFMIISLFKHLENYTYNL